MTREPADVAVLAARLAKAFPSLSAYSAASLADDLCRIERAQRRHAVRCCNGAPDVRRRPERGELFGYCRQVPLPAGVSADPRAVRGMTWTDDPEAEERAGRRIDRSIAEWQKRRKGLLDLTGKTGKEAMRWDLPDVPIVLQGDPSGAVLLLQLPGEAEAKAV